MTITTTTPATNQSVDFDGYKDEDGVIDLVGPESFSPPLLPNSSICTVLARTPLTEQGLFALFTFILKIQCNNCVCSGGFQ
jgi:hypothetical protein